MIGDIRKFRFWCQKVLPLVYDDSLSYYEVLCKVVQYLNKVIEDVNSIPDYIDAVIDERLSDEHLQELIEQFVLNIESAISSNNEGDNTNSSADYNIGQMLWWNGKLYRVIRQIDAGDTFIVDTNIAIVNFEDLFNNFVDEVKHDISANDDGANTTATQSWTAGTWLWLNDVLYKAKVDIAQGTAYVFSGDNANVEQITVESEIANEKVARANADSELETAIGNETLARENADDAIEATIGDLNNLDTTAKNNLVSAINEVNDKTNDVTDIVNNIDIVNVKDYGAVGDGVADDTDAIQLAVNVVNANGGIIYFPKGRYKISDTLHFTHHATTIRGGGQQATFIIQTVDKPAIEMGNGSPNLCIAMRIEDIALHYAGTVLNTSVIGIYMNWCVNSTINNVVVGDFVCGVQFTKVGNSFITETGVSTSRNGAVGFNIGDGSVSTKISSCYCGFTSGDALDTGIGLVMNRGDVADICVDYFDVGNGSIGVFIDGTDSPSDLPPADIRLQDIVCDGSRVAGIQIQNINAQGNIVIDGGWLNVYRSNATACVLLSNVNDISINNVVMQQLLDDTPSPVGISATAVSMMSVIGCQFINLYQAIVNTTCDFVSFINNKIKLYAGKSSAANAYTGIGSYRQTVTNNQWYGSYAAFVYIDGTGDLSIVTNNIFQAGITGVTDNDTNKVVDNNI